MISHLCNALIYNSGLFSGFYSTTSLGDASIATEGGDVLVLEDGSEDKLITENGMVSGSIPGFSGYLKSFTASSDWDITFLQTNQVFDRDAPRRSNPFRTLDCGANSCPSAPVTEIQLNYIGGSSYVHGANEFINGTPVSFYLSELKGTPLDFKYYWHLREIRNDFISYITESQYNQAYDDNLAFLDVSTIPVYHGWSGGIYVYQDKMWLNGFPSIELGEFAEV